MRIMHEMMRILLYRNFLQEFKMCILYTLHSEIREFAKERHKNV